jgi:hypothetical protein
MSTDIPIPTPLDQETPRKNTPPEMGNSGEFEGIQGNFDITDAQFSAIRMTLEGHKDRSISAALDVDRKTLWHWKTHDPEYRRALATMRAQIRDGFADNYQSHVKFAADVVKGLLSQCNDQKLLLRAADILLRHGNHYLHKEPPKP